MDLLIRLFRPWATAVPEALDSRVMEARDRWFNLGFFAAAALVWLLVGLVLTTRDPVLDPDRRVHRGGTDRTGVRADARARSSG